MKTFRTVLFSAHLATGATVLVYPIIKRFLCFI